MGSWNETCMLSHLPILFEDNIKVIINYILHSHCYIKNAPFTTTAIPCGAIEEYDEIMKLLSDSQIDTHRNQYIINLIGHGSIIMWNDMQQFHEDIEPTLAYYKRNIPEYMT